MPRRPNLYGTSSINPKLLGERIKKIRKDLKLNQRKMAKILKISQPLLGFYERGQRRVPIHILLEISKMGEVSLDWLVSGKDFHKERRKKQ